MTTLADDLDAPERHPPLVCFVTFRLVSVLESSLSCPCQMKRARFKLFERILATTAAATHNLQHPLAAIKATARQTVSMPEAVRASERRHSSR